MATNAELVARLYIAYYDRAPDPVGLQYWVNSLNNGVPLVDIANSFAASPEAKATYPYFLLPSALNAQDFLAQVYLNVFGRAIDTGAGSGAEYYGAKLAAGVSAGDVLLEIIQNAATNTTPGNTDAAFLQNKVDVGLYWAQQAAGNLDLTYESDGVTLTAAASASAHGVIDGVDNTAGSVTEGNTEADEFFAKGKDFDLTNNVDLGAEPGQPYYGTEHNDTYHAGPGPSAGISKNTLGAGDVLDGAGGIDKLVITDDAASSLVPNIKNIEQVLVQALGKGDTNVNAVNAVGVEEFWLQNSTQDVNVTNLKENPLFGFDSNIGNGLHEINANFVAGTLGNDATIKLAVNNDGNADFDATVGGGDVIKTLAVTATGKGNVLTAEGGALNAVTTVTVDGTGNLAIDIDQNGLKTFDASKNSGGITVNLTGANTDLTTLGSSGDDVFTYRDIRSTDSTDGGDGIDRIIVTGQDISASNNPLLGGLNAMKSIEIIEFDGNDFVKVDGDTFKNADVTKFLINTDGKSTEIDQIDNARSSIVYAFGDDNDDGAIINMKAGNTTANIAFENRTVNDHAHVTGNLVIKGASTINISSTDSTAGANTENHVETLVNDKGALINVTGDAAFEIGQLAAGATVDGSSMTKSVHFVGSGDSDTLIGGSGDDVLQGDSGITVIDPGVQQVSKLTFSQGGGDVEAGDVYTLKINGTAVTYEVGTNGFAVSAAGLRDGLIQAINNTVGSEVTATKGASNSVIITEDKVGGIATDGFTVTDYSASNRQAVKETSTVTIANGTYDVGDVVKFKVNGVDVSYTVAGGTKSAVEVAAQLASIANSTAGVSNVVDASNGGTNVVTLISDVAGVAFTVTNPDTVDVTKVASTVTFTPNDLETDETLNITIGGVVYQQLYNGSVGNTLSDFVIANEAAIETNNPGLQLTKVGNTLVLTDATGHPITVPVSGVITGGFDGGTVTTAVANGIPNDTVNPDPTVQDDVVKAVQQGADNDQSLTVETVTPGQHGVTIGGINADTYTGGEGKDLFVVATTAATAAAADVITDFKATDGDLIDFSHFGAGSATNYAEGPLSGFASFNDALTQANSDFQTNGNLVYSAQQVGADVYVFANDNPGDGTANEVIKLVGVTLADIDYTHIV